MVRPSLRSGKRKIRKTPKQHYKIISVKKKHNKPVCAECGAILHGTARGSPHEVRKLSKSQRRPSRPYGGYLCSRCLTRRIMNATKAL